MIDNEDLFTEILTEKLISKGIDKVTNLFEKHYKRIRKEAKKELDTKQFDFFEKHHILEASQETVLDNIQKNISSSIIWSDEIKFKTSLYSKELASVFVEVDLYLAPIKTRFDTEEKTEKISSKKILNSFSKNKLIYGGAGAGKTTLIKRIYSLYIKNYKSFNFSFPIVVKFRELDYENHLDHKSFGIYKILINLLGIRIKFPTDDIKDFKFEYYNLLKNTVITFFNDSNVLFIADGFDEIPDNKLKKRIEKEFKELSSSLTNSRFILTSRTNDFQLQLTNTDTYEICSLSDPQIKSLISRWLNDEKKAAELFKKIKKSPYYDTAMRPLTLSHLCAIYERKKTIPPKPRYIYDFVLNLLLEAWDQERDVVRPSKYAEFYVDKKKDFLAHLSFWLSYELRKTVFNNDDLKESYNAIYQSHSLPSNQSKKVITELESHTGILIQTGYSSYQFSHKSLQEFLTAKYLMALPFMPKVSLLNSLPNEMAIMISLSSQPNYFFEVLKRQFKDFDEHFWSLFLSRLVDENPDFNEEPGVIIFFLKTIEREENKNFQTTFMKLLESTNLNVPLKSFIRLYDLRETSQGYVYFVQKIKKSIQHKDHYPSQVHLNLEFYNRIKNYT